MNSKMGNNKVSINVTMIFIVIIILNMYVRSQNQKNPNVRYILLWTHRFMKPYGVFNQKRKYFKMMNCEYQNCYLTENSEYFEDITDYDAILFNSIDIRDDMDIPEIRRDNQIYIFASMESAKFFQLTEIFNWYFNYTWTYKMKSDITYPYFVARSKQSGEVVAPKKEVHWMDSMDMKPTSSDVKDRLKNKKKAVAWFVTNCYANNDRFNYVRNLREALTNYNLEIDIYGECGFKYCPKTQMENCLSLIDSDYYFYLSFENSFSEDYVTEKLMNALVHYAVPVVYGGANYTRFMPHGIYLNANELGEEDMAKKINDAIQDKEKYYDYFRWHNHYSYHDIYESADTDRICALCAFLNNSTVRSERRVYAHITNWWNEKENTNENPIFSYENAYSGNLGYYMTYPKRNTPTPPTVIQSFGQFVEQLYNYYFDSK